MILGSCRSTNHSKAMLKLLLRSCSEHESCHCYASLRTVYLAIRLPSGTQDVLFKFDPAEF